MQKIELYENLRDAISEDLTELVLLDGEPEQELLTTVAEKYVTAVDFYNRQLLYLIDQGIALDSDLLEFYEILTKAEHPAREMFYSATTHPRHLIKTLLADHLEHSQKRLLSP